MNKQKKRRNSGFPAVGEFTLNDWKNAQYTVYCAFQSVNLYFLFPEFPEIPMVQQSCVRPQRGKQSLRPAKAKTSASLCVLCG